MTMPRIHLLTKKEDIIPEKLTHHTVIVIDTLLATTTMAMLLEHGARSVVPVQRKEEALTAANNAHLIIAGEQLGFDIEGMKRPDPYQLISEGVQEKEIVLLSTNGTVALKQSQKGKYIYAVSPFTVQAAANIVSEKHSHESMIIVCSGNHGRFSLEDFITAGHFLSVFLENKNNASWELSDGSIAAYSLYQHTPLNEVRNMYATSETASFLHRYGYHPIWDSFTQGIHYPFVPQLIHGKILKKHVTI